MAVSSDWPRHRVFPSLAGDEVHFWYVRVDSQASQMPTLQSLLSANEKEQAGRFYFLRDRKRYVVAHAVLRILLGHYLQQSPQTIVFDQGEYGKPVLPDPQLPYFNLSHSGNMILYGFGYRNLGVDVEQICSRRADPALATRFFSPAEVNTLRALPKAQQTMGFFNCWTRKEAYIKAIGKGLAQPLDEFAVSLTPGQPAALEWIAHMPSETSRWSLVSFDLGTEYVGAAAVEGAGWQARYGQYYS